MARRHVVDYYLEQENLYLDMLSNLQDFKDLLKEQKISIEDYEQACKEIEKVKENYERLAYIMFLLNKPNKKDKEESKKAKEWYKALNTVSREAILDESKDALAHIKKLIEEGKLHE